jgi:hypothetical protein
MAMGAWKYQIYFSYFRAPMYYSLFISQICASYWMTFPLTIFN